MSRALWLAALALGLASSPAAAQWRIGLDLGVDRIPVMARDAEDPDGPLRMRPTQTWPLVASVHRGGERLRAGLSVQRVAPGLELDGLDLTVALRPAFQVLTITPELSGRLARLAGNGALRGHLGVPIERWSFGSAVDPARWRAGLSTGAAVELPLGERYTARIATAIGVVFRNPLVATEMGDGYNPTRMWRRSLRIGVQKRL